MSRFLWLAALFLVVATTAYPQTASEPSSLSGSVQDQTGAAIVGAKVEISVDKILRQSTVTDQSGNFRFARISPAKYQLQVTSEGFEPTTVDVTVGAQPPAPLRIALEIAGVREEATVTSEPSQITTEASDNKDSAALSEQSLSNLPVFDQDYVGTMSGFLDPGSVGTNGVTLIVNGMEVNNLGVSASAIKEIKINQDTYSAEYQRPGRGRIEVITKPGSTDYHGTFNFIFRDAHLNARDPFALSRPPEQRRIYEGYLSGPVRGSKKTSFLVSVNRNEEDNQSIVFAQNLTGALQRNVPAPVRNLLVAIEISHALSDANNFSVRYSYLGERTDNRSVGGTVLRIWICAGRAISLCSKARRKTKA